jgi:hypothetical protein
MYNTIKDILYISNFKKISNKDTTVKLDITNLNNNDYFKDILKLNDINHISYDMLLNISNKFWSSKSKDIEKIVFSMKEARDSYYIQEILEMNKDKKQNIFITSDKILTFRCLLNKISVINTLNGIIRYIVLFDNNKFRIIGNPFEIFDNTKDNIIIQEPNNMISHILSNPTIKLKLDIAQKYVRIPKNHIYSIRFYHRCSLSYLDFNNNIENNKLKKNYIYPYKDELHILLIESQNFNNLDDIINKIKYISECVNNDNVNYNDEDKARMYKSYLTNDLSFACYLINNKFIFYDDLTKKIPKKSTYSFMFILAILVSGAGNGLNYFHAHLLILLLDHVFPDYDLELDYEEILIIGTNNNMEVYDESNIMNENGDFQFVINLIKTQNPNYEYDYIKESISSEDYYE